VTHKNRKRKKKSVKMLMSPDSSQKIVRIQVQECTQSQQHHQQHMHQQIPQHISMQNAFLTPQVQGQAQKFQQQHLHQQQQTHILKIKSDNICHSVGNGGNNNKLMLRPPTPTDYPKNYPVMDTTVASSMKGEPELNIGKNCQL
jgi:hypothetical protein